VGGAQPVEFCWPHEGGGFGGAGLPLIPNVKATFCCFWIGRPFAFFERIPRQQRETGQWHHVMSTGWPKERSWVWYTPRPRCSRVHFTLLQDARFVAISKTYDRPYRKAPYWLTSESSFQKISRSRHRDIGRVSQMQRMSRLNCPTGGPTEGM
jgi:hypothetical protein